MWNRIAKFLYRKPSNHVGLDISSGTVKIAEVANRKGSLSLERFGEVEIPRDMIQNDVVIDKEKLGEIIRTLLGTTGITCREVTAGLGGRKVYSREIVMPMMEEKEMKEAIKWDIDQYVPFPAETYYYDFAVLGQAESESEVKVLVVVAQQKNIDALREICNIAGLNLFAVDFEALAVKRTLEQEQNILIVDIGADICQVIIYQGGYPALVRAIPIGGRQFTEAIMNVKNLSYQEAELYKCNDTNLFYFGESGSESELWQPLRILTEDLGREIRRTFEYFQMQNQFANVIGIYLSGGGAKLQGLAAAVNKHVHIPVTIHDPFGQLQTSASYDKKYLDGVSSKFAIAVGLGLRGVIGD